jgi:hypothetical protein
MGPAEKKVVVALSVVLVALIGVLVLWKPATKVAAPMGPGSMGSERSGPAAESSSGACATTPGASAEGVPTQEFGKKGAKVEIVAMLPITHHCHDNTEATLKEAYKKYPNDVHLTIMDLFGKDGQAAVQQYGGQRALVVINGKSTFTLGGRQVALERTEGQSYQVSDIIPIVDQELKAKG